MTLTDIEARLQEPASTEVVDVESEQPLITESQRATVRVLEAGILPHGTRERDHVDKLLSPPYNLRGGLGYAEEIARYHSRFPNDDILPPMTHAQFLASQLGFDPHKEWTRQHLEQYREGIMITIADHMFGYIEDAQEMINAANNLASMLEPLDESLRLGRFLYDPKPEVRHALAGLTRLQETLEYATQPIPKKSRMNIDLVNVTTDVTTDAVNDRIKEATYDKTIGQIKEEIVQLVLLETGRLDFWIDQLSGHPEQPAQPDRSAVKGRMGLIETKHPMLRAIILQRMSAVAAQFSLRQDENKEK